MHRRVAQRGAVRARWVERALQRRGGRVQQRREDDPRGRPAPARRVAWCGVVGRGRRARAWRAHASAREDRPRHHRHRGARWRDAGQACWSRVRGARQRGAQRGEEVRVDIRSRRQPPRVRRRRARSPRGAGRMTDVTFGAAFTDREVASLYRHRPPYPKGVFDILARLLVEPRTILDAGAGTGALARELVKIAARVDALDPSAPMIDEGRRLPNGAHPRLRWVIGRAEDGPVDPPYGLITCGASLHW